MERYCIADLQVDMDCFGRTVEQARPYRAESDGPADMTIVCTPERVQEAGLETVDRELGAYLLSGVLFAGKLLRFEGFQLHASAVIAEGKAYLFSAPSGTGKSTHTEKWCRLFGARYLNDDKPVLRCTEQGWMAYGTPWSGKHDISSPERVELGGIAFLQRGENKIERLTAQKAIPLVMDQCIRNLPRELMLSQLKLLDKLLQQVPVWRLTCRNEDAAAELSYGEMVKRGR